MNGESDGTDPSPARGARRRPVEAVIVVGVVLLAVLLAWIDPLLVVLVAVGGGIFWLRRSDADPVHWGPVPRRHRAGRFRIGRGGAGALQRTGTAGVPEPGRRTVRTAGAPGP